MAKAIKVENLSKAYQIGEFTTGTLSRDLERWWALARGKEDPFLKIGETNVRSSKGESNVVWSLKDLNFEVEQGEAIGIIGKNGAGKSTLLKVLSQVTTPTRGTIKMKGRVASLLEVGTGFHPELTGKENIYLNGAILGMQKAEVKRKFDEIVDFSGVERYIDTPVKRYSSGMYVRLAFAVAAHLDSEILIVDEVLAVGDAEFQKKCIGKMGDISRGEGRTILFVSHVLSMIESLCSQTILLEDGLIRDIDKTKVVLDTYLNTKFNKSNKSYLNENEIDNLERPWGRTFSKIIYTELKNCGDGNSFYYGQELILNFKIRCTDKIDKSRFQIRITNEIGEDVTISYMPKPHKYFTIAEGVSEFTVSIENKLFPGNYYISIYHYSLDNAYAYDAIRQLISFTILKKDENNFSYLYESYQHMYTYTETEYEHSKDVSENKI